MNSWNSSRTTRNFEDCALNKLYATVRHRFVTPKGELSMVTQSNQYTSWVTEHSIKEKQDIDLLGECMTSPKCDVAAANHEVAANT